MVPLGHSPGVNALSRVVSYYLSKTVLIDPKNDPPNTSISMMQHRSQRKRKQTRSKASSFGRAGPSVLWDVTAQPNPGMKQLASRDNKVHNFIQSFSYGNVVTSSTASAQKYSRSFSSADITQFSSFAAVFDQYRIMEVEIWMTPSGPSCGAPYANSSGARAYSVIDYDDASNLSTSSAALQYENCMAGTLRDGHYRKFKPHLAVGAYSGSAFSQFMNINTQWIDVGSTNVAHYGFKFIVDTTAANGDVIFDAFARIHVQFRNVF